MSPDRVTVAAALAMVVVLAGALWRLRGGDEKVQPTVDDRAAEQAVPVAAASAVGSPATSS